MEICDSAVRWFTPELCSLAVRRSQLPKPPQADDDLRFEEGDQVEVLDMQGSIWQPAVVSGVAGTNSGSIPAGSLTVRRGDAQTCTIIPDMFGKLVRKPQSPQTKPIAGLDAISADETKDVEQWNPDVLLQAMPENAEDDSLEDGGKLSSAPSPTNGDEEVKFLSGHDDGKDCSMKKAPSVSSHEGNHETISKQKSNPESHSGDLVLQNDAARPPCVPPIKNDGAEGDRISKIPSDASSNLDANSTNTAHSNPDDLHLGKFPGKVSGLQDDLVDKRLYLMAPRQADN